MRRRVSYLQIICLALFVGFLAGCATEYQPLPETTQRRTPVPVKKIGVYHKVQKGQTLWSIAQAYGVPLQEIINSNNIPNAGAIEVNQLLFIPGAVSVKTISAVHTPDENKKEFAWPLRGKIVVYFDDTLGRTISHGIDIQAPPGTPVKASREGRVILADYLSGYGQTVMIDHGDGFISVYSHNAKLMVKSGDYVYKGDPVAQVGRIGRRSVEHFEIRRGSEATNPLYYLP